MCGISGIVWNEAHACQATRAIVRAMDLAQAHRGPDGEGVLVADERELRLARWDSRGAPVPSTIQPARLGSTCFGLGHRRLSIVDVEGGAQPMPDASGRVWVAFNGEIYNHRDLRALLEPSGARFRTRSDTEVILHAFLRWGEACVERLDGMFAFAIWDERSDTLLLARDRLGIKPLVWARTPTALLFASEIKGLLASGLVARTPQPSAIKQFLHNLYVPAPESAIENVEVLEPGRTLSVHRGRIEKRRYWQVTFEPAPARHDRDWVEEFRTRLQASVRSHLMSDVPLGAFLSGGLDSSAVVALMARSNGGARVLASTVGFDVPEYDETADARTVAEHTGADYDEVVLRESDTEDIVDDVLRIYDQPYADPSAIPTYLLCRAARRRVKVALAGDGADELLAGYPRHRHYAALSGLAQLPRPGRALVALAARLGSKFVRPLQGRRTRNLERYLSGASPALDDIDTYAYLRNPFRNGWYERTIAHGFRDRVRDVDPAAHIRAVAGESQAPNRLQRLLHVELMTYLPNDILHKIDIASMAVGLEVRVPFLDRSVVELVAGMPLRLKLGPATTKVVLRRAVRDLLPARTLGKKKQGFHIPIGNWFRGHGRALLNDVLLSPRSLERGHLDPLGVRALVAEHLSGDVDHSTRLWALLQLEVWHRTYVDASQHVVREAVAR